MALVLYHVEDAAKEKQLSALCRELHLTARRLTNADRDRAVAALCGEKVNANVQKAPAGYKLPEVLIFSGFAGEMLDVFLARSCAASTPPCCYVGALESKVIDNLKMERPRGFETRGRFLYKKRPQKMTLRALGFSFRLRGWGRRLRRRSGYRTANWRRGAYRRGRSCGWDRAYRRLCAPRRLRAAVHRDGKSPP